jgi:hypothetical protein
VKDKLLFESIEYVNTTYLFEELATYFSDLVWQFSTVQNKKVQVSLLLLEHKSMVDKYTAFQVLDEISSDLHPFLPKHQRSTKSQ